MPKNPLTMTVDVTLSPSVRLIELAKSVLVDPQDSAAAAALARLVLESVRPEATAPRRFTAALPTDVPETSRRSASEPANTDEWERKIQAAESSRADKS